MNPEQLLTGPEPRVQDGTLHPYRCAFCAFAYNLKLLHPAGAGRMVTLCRLHHYHYGDCLGFVIHHAGQVDRYLKSHPPRTRKVHLVSQSVRQIRISQIFRAVQFHRSTFLHSVLYFYSTLLYCS